MSVYLTVRLLVPPSLWLCVYLTVRLIVPPSLWLSVYLSVRLLLWLAFQLTARPPSDFGPVIFLLAVSPAGSSSRLGQVKAVIFYARINRVSFTANTLRNASFRPVLNLAGFTFPLLSLVINCCCSWLCPGLQKARKWRYWIFYHCA